MTSPRRKTFVSRGRVNRIARGFTIVELLVAGTIMIGLLTIIGMVMNQTSRAVEASVATQDVSTYAAGLSNSMRDDFRRLRKDAYMVIKNQSLQATGSTRQHNADQIMFFGSGPWTSQMFDSAGQNKRNVQSNLARVWYGHLASNTANATMGQGFQPGYDDAGGQIEPHKWTLGRHVLLVTNRNYTEFPAVSGKRAPVSLWQQKDSVIGGVTYRGIASGEWDVLADSPAFLPASFASNDLSDILLQAADPNPAAVTAGLPSGYETAAPSLYLSSPGYNVSGVWPGGATTLQQNSAIANACFRIYGTRFIQGNGDLRVAAQLASNVAAPFCSDFQVEFAGDYADNAGTASLDNHIDVEDASELQGLPLGNPATGLQPIYWYGSLNSSTHATRANRRRYVEPTATYGSDTVQGPLNFYTYPDANASSPNQPYTAVFGPDQATTPWPKLIRITIVLHDERGRFHEGYKTSQTTANPLPVTQDGRTFQYILEVP